MKKRTIQRAELKKFLHSAEFPHIVQKNHEKYKEIWLSWAETHETISLATTPSWNWNALIFGAFWMLYRKMYLGAAILITAVYQLEGAIMSSAGDSEFVESMGMSIFVGDDTLFSINILSGLVALLIPAIFGNSWYLWRCVNLANEAKKRGENASLTNASPTNASMADYNANAFLQKAGGTNLKVPLGCALLCTILLLGLIALYIIFAYIDIFLEILQDILIEIFSDQYT